MSGGLSNWTFRDVQNFLLHHGFSLHHTRGSHYYFNKFDQKRFFMTHVQHHGSKSIPEGTLHAIIQQSGIPKNLWLNKIPKGIH